MKIKIDAKGEKRPVRLSFWIPAGVAGLPAVSNLLVKKTGGRVSPRQLRALVKAIRETHKKFGPLTIVDVESADGDIVKISI